MHKDVIVLRRDLSRILLASTAGASVLSTRAQAQSTCTTGPCYPPTPAETAAGFSINTSYPPGAWRRYGADPSGTTDSSTAINNALTVCAEAFDDCPGGGLYLVSQTIRFQRNGQRLLGQGSGEASSACTTLSYSGSGGTIVSFSNTTLNFSDCLIDGILLNGNNLANVGVEVYNDNIAGGSWRNKLANCAIWYVTAGTNPTAVFLGLRNSAPSFANDSIFDSLFIEGAGRGFAGKGAAYRLNGCTVQGCSDAAIHAESGAFWTASSTVFSSNNRDFDGATIQMFSAFGCWFENSTNGIYRAAGGHTASFQGCLLHTNCVSLLMDFGDAAGNAAICACEFGQLNKSTVIANLNTTGVYDFRLSGVSSGGYGKGNVQSASATLTNGQTLVLPLGRGTFFVGVDIWFTGSANQRSQATYSAFLFDGDNEAVSLIASHTGSGGPQPYTLAPSTNSVTLTYTGAQTVAVFVSGSGVTG